MSDSLKGVEVIRILGTEDRDVVFDLDGTLLQGDLGETVFFHFMLQQDWNGGAATPQFKALDLSTSYAVQGERALELSIYQDLLLQGERERAYIFTARVLSRFPKDRVRTIAVQLLSMKRETTSIHCELELPGDVQRECNIPYGAVIRPQMEHIVRHLADCGARLWIVSASPQEVAEGCGDLLHFPRTNVLATYIEGQEAAVARFPWDADKLRVLRESGVNEPLIVFGNGVEDTEMLASAKFSVVMQDGNSDLLTVAKERGWYIHNPSTRFEFTA